jgi:transposase
MTDGKAKPIDYQQGNTKQSLSTFIQKLTEQQKASIKTVNTDMSKAYVSSIKEQLPKADIIIDKFHLESLLNTAIDTIRKGIMVEMVRKTNKYIMKKKYEEEIHITQKDIERKEKQMGILTEAERRGTRWVLLKRQSHHNEDQAGLLARLEKINSPLYKAYLLKEQFYEIYKPGSNVERSVGILKGWIEEVKQTELRALTDFCKTLETNMDYITNYFKYGKTSGGIEGVNNKIKVIKRMAYGYKDQQYFFRKIRSKYCNLPRLHLLFATT